MPQYSAAFCVPPENKKIPISFGNQDFTVFCFSTKWCHQYWDLIFNQVIIKLIGVF